MGSETQRESRNCQAGAGSQELYPIKTHAERPIGRQQKRYNKEVLASRRRSLCLFVSAENMSETAPAPAAKAAGAKKSSKASCPSVSELIVKAVSASKERSGVSLPALKKVLSGCGYDVENSRLKLALKALVTKETLVQVKGSGASGLFKLNKKQTEGKTATPKKAPAKVKKPAPKKVAKSPAKAKKPAAKSPKKAKKPAVAKKAAKSPKKVKAAKPKKVAKSPAKKASKPKAVKSPAKGKKAAPKKR
uniref:H15 domain-containing protein n=1 Tax=Leptobrachium leishanense TaxID=445787 RepID=A0A8C5WGD2_9ANUR